jgi:Hint domain
MGQSKSRGFQTGMSAEHITVGIYALDDVLLPKRPAGKGWLASLADARLKLRVGAVPLEIVLEDGPGGLALSEPVMLAGQRHAAGTGAAVEAVPGHATLFLVRIAGKPLGLASSRDWRPGDELVPAPETSIPGALAAFTSGTRIDTPDGPRLVEDLAAGDLVSTLAAGSRPVVWVGRRRVSAVELVAHPGLRPVCFAPGAAGNERALLVSPLQRMLIDDWRAEVYFGEDRVLVAAKALVDDAAVKVILPPAGVEYVVLLCDRHEVLLAEGALAESFHPGKTGLEGLPPEARAELAALVPEAELIRRRAAFPIVRSSEARALRLS